LSESDSGPQRMRLVRVQFMPKHLESGVLYVSEEYGTAAHLCACGCSAKIRTPLGPEEWRVFETKDGPSLYPSVGNWQQKCQSHYMIIRGEVRHYRAWTPAQVEAGRLDDQDRMRAHFTRRAVERLLAEAVSERSADVSDLVNSYRLIFHVAPDTDGFLLQGGPVPLVRFTERSLEQAWVLGHAAWLALDAYGALIVIIGDGRIRRGEFDGVKRHAEAQRAFNIAVDAAEEIGRAKPEAVIKWPTGIPTRDPGVNRTGDEEDTVELVNLATAYAFLHAAKHVAFAVDGDAPDDPIIEEFECDRFARNFLLDRVQERASCSGADIALLISNRTIGIALGLFFNVMLASRDGRLVGDTHPGLSECLANALRNAPDRMVIFFSSVLLAWLRRTGSMPDEIVYSDGRDLLRQLIATL
jgi:hypothetical protein